MKIVRGTDAKRFENASSCTAFEFQTGNQDINLARIEITGRYPLEGSAVNNTVTELVYVEEGEGDVSINNEVASLKKGDVILIEKGERVWWEGGLTLIISCTPAWTSDQYKAAD